MPAMVEYINRDSVFHRLNPITKISWTFSVIIISFILKEPSAILVVFASNLLFAAFSGIFKNIIPVIRGLTIFAFILVLFQIFFVTEGRTLFYVFPFANAGQVTDVGLELSFLMALRMLTTVSTIPMLMMTTSMTDMVVVLVEKLKVPFKYAFMFITALRFIPTFMQEMDQILQAQMSRGYNSDTKNPFKKFIIIIPLAIPLLVSSIKKTSAMAISMEVRGFGSGPRSHYRVIKMKKADYLAITVMLISIAAVLL